jgi:hypothetical protein
VTIARNAAGIPNTQSTRSTIYAASKPGVTVGSY